MIFKTPEVSKAGGVPALGKIGDPQIVLKDTKLRNKQGKWFFKKNPTIISDNKVAVFHGEPKPFNCSDQFIIDNWK